MFFRSMGAVEWRGSPGHICKRNGSNGYQLDIADASGTLQVQLGGVAVLTSSAPSYKRRKAACSDCAQMQAPGLFTLMGAVFSDQMPHQRPIPRVQTLL